VSSPLPAETAVNSYRTNDSPTPTESDGDAFPTMAANDRSALPSSPSRIGAPDARRRHLARDARSDRRGTQSVPANAPLGHGESPLRYGARAPAPALSPARESRVAAPLRRRGQRNSPNAPNTQGTVVAAGGQYRRRRAPPPRLLGSHGQEYFHVQDLLDFQQVDQIPHFLVHWKGYSRDESTWEPAASLREDVPELVDGWVAASRRRDPTPA
jgi:hypothetical protein